MNMFVPNITVWKSLSFSGPLEVLVLFRDESSPTQGDSQLTSMFGRHTKYTQFSQESMIMIRVPKKTRSKSIQNPECGIFKIGEVAWNLESAVSFVLLPKLYRYPDFCIKCKKKHNFCSGVLCGAF